MKRVKWFDTIRVLGLFLILVYHLFYRVLPGGFLGVDIFFTLSGYLITATIIGEVRKQMNFDVLHFFQRRLFRIFLPLLLSLALTLPLALLISPDFTVGIAKDIAAALGFATNWHQIFSGSSYEAQLLPPLYMHTWFLAVEMQFYLIWGLLCFGLAALTKYAKKQLLCFQLSILSVSVIFAFGSFWFMRSLYHAGSDLSAIYFNTFARLFPFLFGSATAVLWSMFNNPVHPSSTRRVPMSRIMLRIIPATLTVATIIALAARLNFNNPFVFRYGFLIMALLSVVLICSARAIHSVTPQRMQEPRMIRMLAKLSYAIYLLHWPLYVVFSALILNNAIASIVTLIVSFAFSVLVVYGLEYFLNDYSRIRTFQYKRFAKAVAVAASLAVLLLSGAVFYRAPEITSIELSFGDSPSPSRYAYDGISGLMEKKHLLELDLASISAGQKLGKESENILLANRFNRVDGGVTIIGDSVALGAQSTLSDAFDDCHIDATVSRPINEGHELVMEWQSSGKLREYVVIALGTNGHHQYEELFTQIIEDLEPGRRLILVTPFDGRSNANAEYVTKTADWLRGLPKHYDYVTIADWNALIQPQVGLLAGDKVHMHGQESMSLFTDCVVAAVAEASQKPAKGE